MAARLQEDPFEDWPDDDDDDDDDDERRRRAPDWVFPPVGAEPTEPPSSSYVGASV
jgi:hypothetical protein